MKIELPDELIDEIVAEEMRLIIDMPLGKNMSERDAEEQELNYSAKVILKHFT